MNAIVGPATLRGTNTSSAAGPFLAPSVVPSSAKSALRYRQQRAVPPSHRPEEVLGHRTSYWRARDHGGTSPRGSRRAPAYQTMIYFWRKDKDRKRGEPTWQICSLLSKYSPLPLLEGNMRRYVRLSNVTRHAMQAAALSIPCSRRWRP